MSLSDFGDYLRKREWNFHIETYLNCIQHGIWVDKHSTWFENTYTQVQIYYHDWSDVFLNFEYRLGWNKLIVRCRCCVYLVAWVPK